MKNFIFSVVAVLLSLTLMAQEGTVFAYKISSSKGPTGVLSAYFSEKGSRLEMQMSVPQLAGGGFTRINIVKSENPDIIFQLDDRTKTYTTMKAAAAKTAAGDNRIVNIMGPEKVAGYSCTHVEVIEGAVIREYWVTTEISDYEKYNNSTAGGNSYMGTSDDYAAMARNGAPGFVVKSFSKDPRGGDITTELQKMEKKALADALFIIPADYKISVPGGQQAEGIDLNKLQNMTPEEREKYIEEMRKKYNDVK